MSHERERFAAELSGCGCCSGIDLSSPVRIYNRPGLDEIAYRIGTHALFKESLLASLSSSHHPQLVDLKTREDDDFTIALIDAFSCVADVLTFYQERLANEAFLRSADERLSLRQLARLIGYKLSPGVAADAWLAFTLEEAPGAPSEAVGRTTVAVGTRVQSTPGPDEKPQIYETVEEIAGRVAWNAIRPPLNERHPLASGISPLFFAGLATALKPGDGVLFPPAAGGAAFGVITGVETIAELQITRASVAYLTAAPERGAVPNFQDPDPALAAPASEYLGETWAGADLAAEAEVEGFDVDELLATFQDNPAPPPNVMVLRSRAAVFGHNAPAWNVLPLPLKVQEKKYSVAGDGSVTLVETIPAPFASSADWIDAKTLADLDDGSDHLYLDSAYPGIDESGTVVLRSAGTWAIYEVEKAADVTHTGFNLSAKVTRLQLDGSDELDQFGPRSTTVYGGGEVLPLARTPVTSDFAADGDGWIDLDGWVPGLETGRKVLLSGRAVGGEDEPVSEAAYLEEVEYDLWPDGGTRVRLSPVPQYVYARDSVTINANVAAATHGESVEEILGSGDARVPYQSFVLAQPPLTFVGAAGNGGRVSTLEIRVNDVLWHEVDSLYDHPPQERIYVTRQTDDGKTIVQFGDGVTGARLPTGTNNVRARYRKGIGLDGRVGDGQLDVLVSRPLGLKGVDNPLPAEGGEDPETLDEARTNAPLTVTTLGRAVSLQDYEDYARTFAGIAKAQATWTWTGKRRSVFLSVAAAGGAEVTEGGTLHSSLTQELRQHGDPNVPLTVASYRKALFRLDADLFVDPDYLGDVVLEAARDALREAFSFERRDFGRPVPLSEVVLVLQDVEGVVAVDVNKLYRTDAAEDLNAILPAEQPLAGTHGAVEGAEILFLDPAPLDTVRAKS